MNENIDKSSIDFGELDFLQQYLHHFVLALQVEECMVSYLL